MNKFILMLIFSLFSTGEANNLYIKSDNNSIEGKDKETKQILFPSISDTVPSVSNKRDKNWYEKSFYLLHWDYHTAADWEIGRDANPVEISRLIGLSKPDVIQIHAKGRPGWTTYPSKIGNTPPKLVRDVLQIWKDIAVDDGYHFSVYYNIGRDAEIMKKHPGWNRLKANGRLANQALCFNSGVAENYLFPMIKEIMEKYHPDGFWFDGSSFTVENCYCDKCLERFKKEQGISAPRKPDDAGWDAYKEMQRQIYREFLQSTISYIKSIDPNCLIAVNLAWSFIMPEAPNDGVDYLTGDFGNKLDEIPKHACWYDSQGKPFDIMTLISYSDGGEIHPKPKDQIEQEMAIVIANGGRYFAWDNTTPETKLSEERNEFLGNVVSPFLRLRQKWCLGSTRLPDVSLFHGAASHYAYTRKSEREFLDNPTISNADKILRQLHLNHEMVSDTRLRQQDIRGKLLVVANPLALTESNLSSLRKYVERGGILLISGQGAINNQLNDLVGVNLEQMPDSVSNYTIKLGKDICTFHQTMAKVQPRGATVLLSANSDEGEIYPLLTKNEYGKGKVYGVFSSLFTTTSEGEVPMKIYEKIFNMVFPDVERIVTTSAPATTEIILREKDGEKVLHMVNMDEGERENIISNIPGRRKIVSTVIKSIPPAPPCVVSLKLPQKPDSVILEPRGVSLTGWKYKNGRLITKVPSFNIHQMITVK